MNQIVQDVRPNHFAVGREAVAARARLLATTVAHKVASVSRIVAKLMIFGLVFLLVVMVMVVGQDFHRNMGETVLLVWRSMMAAEVGPVRTMGAQRRKPALFGEMGAGPAVVTLTVQPIADGPNVVTDALMGRVQETMLQSDGRSVN